MVVLEIEYPISDKDQDKSKDLRVWDQERELTMILIRSWRRNLKVYITQGCKEKTWINIIKWPKINKIRMTIGNVQIQFLLDKLKVLLNFKNNLLRFEKRYKKNYKHSLIKKLNR